VGERGDGAAPPPHEVVAGLLLRQGRTLLCRRAADRAWYPGVWDLAGGHVDAGESPTAALVRELTEELGIMVAEPVGPELVRITTSEFDMQVWMVDRWTGDVVNAAPDEHAEVRWFTADELAGLDLAHASYLALLTSALATVA
jgi:8-oxo-dGTP diphosphatase